jgi:outer membrane protein OmpA-like peptidoglycan-associated protein
MENSSEKLAHAFESSGGPGGHRVAGEDAPLWLSAAFALLGIFLALTVTTSFKPEQDASAERAPPPVVAVAAQEDGLPPPMGGGALWQAFPEARPEPERGASEAAPATANDAAAETTPAPQDCPKLFSIAFARGSAQPNIAGLEGAAQALREWLARRAETRLSVEGHTDARGSERYNFVLSFLRAKSVRLWLAGYGIPEEQMVLRGAGPGPFNGGSNTQDEENRRVYLQIEGVPGCR